MTAFEVPHIGQRNGSRFPAFSAFLFFPNAEKRIAAAIAAGEDLGKFLRVDEVLAAKAKGFLFRSFGSGRSKATIFYAQVKGARREGGAVSDEYPERRRNSNRATGIT